MNIINYIFSFLCIQEVSRSFVICGRVLPFCQRCTGVYIGLGISFVYLLASGYYKKGLPPRIIIYVNIASLLITPIFGFHLLDPGPAWRLWSGLIFGNAIAFLLCPATLVICNPGKAFGHNTKVSTFCFFLLFVFLSIIPLWFPIQSSFFYYGTLALALAGVLGVLLCIAATIVFLIKKVAVPLILKGFSNGYSKN
ncbi:MAG: DUF2085 domain-containing protein [Sedimentisphaerales bacterium]|nr:DUF2085 domain-containing protein [Sedimentisphaerales bacterium]